MSALFYLQTYWCKCVLTIRHPSKKYKMYIHIYNFWISDLNINIYVFCPLIFQLTGKFGFGVQNEAGQRLTEFFKKHTGHSKHPGLTAKDSTHGHHHMVNPKTRLIIFFGAKDGEAPYSQQNKTRSWLCLRSLTHCKIQS